MSQRRFEGERVAFGVTALLLLLLVVSSSSTNVVEPAPRAFDVGAVAVLAAAYALAGLGWWAPATGAFGNLLCTALWYEVGYTSALINLPYLVAFYLLGASGDRRRQVAVGGLAVLSSSALMLLRSDESAVSAASAVGWTLAALLYGELSHNRRALVAEYATRAAQAEADREREAQRRVTQARLEIARDLHDVLAHTVSVMAVQAGVGQDALRRREEGEASAALGTIRAAGKEAMGEIQALVSVLRNDSDQARFAPAPGLDRVPDLVDVASTAGLDITVDMDLQGVTIPDLVDVTAYRVIQESLTNVVRHASAASVAVDVTATGRTLHVRVRDDGSARGAPDAAGFGLRGMRERVASLAGTVDAGPHPEGGWAVEARIPLDRR